MNFLEQQINPFLVKWARRKYKRLRRAKGKTRRKLAEIASAFPGMFAHWKHGAMPTGSTVGARCRETGTPGVRREALRCIPGAAGMNSEGGSWIA